MSEQPIDAAEADKNASIQNEASEPTSSDPTRRGPGRRTAISMAVSVIVGLISVYLFQSAAAESDFQNANLASMIITLIVGLFLIIQLHRVCRFYLHRLVVPLAVATILLFFVGRFQWDGFSGEMLPQFRDRFAADLELQDHAIGDESPSPQTLGDSSGIALADSPGFLGPDRSGVVKKRLFSISDSSESPRERWRIGLGEGWSAFSVKGGRAVTLEQRGEQEWLTCYRLADGKLLWSNAHDGRHENALGGIGPRSTPTIVDDRVYAQGATGYLWCVDLVTGQTIWSADLLSIAGWNQLESEVAAPWGRSASPLIVDGLCVIPLGAANTTDEDNEAMPGRSLIAFDAKNGEEIWRAGSDQLSYASPVVMQLGGTRQIVTVNEKTVTGHQITDGTMLWTLPWPGQTNGGANCASAIQVDGDRFLIGKGYGGGSALVRVTSIDGAFSAQKDWESTRYMKTKFTHACVAGNVSYSISNGILQANAVDSGDLIWSQSRRDRAGSGQIILVEDVIVVQNEKGDVSFVQAGTNEYTQIFRLEALDSKTWNIPTVAGRHLLVRNDREGVCYLLPARE